MDNTLLVNTPFCWRTQQEPCWSLLRQGGLGTAGDPGHPSCT